VENCHYDSGARSKFLSKLFPNAARLPLDRPLDERMVSDPLVARVLP
jgi:hypothetical protein